MIEGSDTYREEDLFRGIGSWLRKLGWETRKTNHALRAYSGSQVAMKYGIYDAQAWLRHSTVKVTEDSYSQIRERLQARQPGRHPRPLGHPRTPRAPAPSVASVRLTFWLRQAEAMISDCQASRAPGLACSRIVKWCLQLHASLCACMIVHQPMKALRLRPRKQAWPKTATPPMVQM